MSSLGHFKVSRTVGEKNLRGQVYNQMGPREKRRLVDNSWLSIPVLEKQVDCVSCQQSSVDTVPPAKLLISHEYSGESLKGT